MADQTFPDIKILRINYLRGPSIWTYRPIIEALVDLGELEDHPSNTIPGFNDRINAWLPGLVEHHCGVGHRGGFLTRLVGGTWMGHIMEHVSIELQILAGARAEFGKAREISRRGVYKVVVRTEHEELGRRSFLTAHALVMAAINDRPFDVSAAVEALKKIVDKYCLGPSTACIVDAAAERKIPFIRLTEGNLVQLGYGSRQRRIWTAETDRTSAIAESISSDKDLTKQLLSQCGVPVPEGQLVDSPEAAWVAAQEIGLPVVVKPYDGNRGRGVSLDLQTQSSVEAAWHAARLESKYVLVERYVRGEEHRLLVVGDRVVAATRGETVSITGDGVSTIEQLVNTQVNNDPRRGDIEIYPLAAVRFHGPDHLIHLLEIQRQGLEPTSVPTLGQRVIVQRNGNLNIDVTDDIHPDVAAIATLATRVVGLDIAGIDIVAQDITRPLLEQGGAVIEVNAGPGLLMHRKPAVGKPRPVGEAIMQHLFGSQEHARIPIVGVIGSQQTPQIAQLTAWLLHLSGRRTGLANQQGLFMAQRQVESRDARGFDFAERLLINRALDAAVIETSPRHILEDGLPYDRCAIAIVTDMPVTDDVLRDEHDIINEEKMRNVVRTQVDVVLATGAAVLNADEPAIVSLAELCDGEVVYYARNFNQPLLKEHRQQGHRVVSCRDGQVILARGEQETALFHLDVTLFSRLLNEGLELPTLLASVAAAWALDITPQLIRAGLKNFGQTPSATSPNPTVSA